MTTVTERVQACADAETAHQREILSPLGPDVEDLLDVIEALLRGGKRLRASFLTWGYCAVSGTAPADVPEDVITMATAMEFFQAAALLHDDVMDGSDTRRGAPAAHVELATRHEQRRWDGPSERFGLAGAILAGNLCLTASDELFARADLPGLGAARALFAKMRTQLMGGQFLDVVESVRPWADLSDTERLDRADRVIRYKSAIYSVQHPLLIGALAAHAGPTQLEAFRRFGLDIGRAFQLRDDLLGVFGDPSVTGKPSGDDLREGKRTVLVAATLARLDPDRGGRLIAGLGDDDPDVIAALQHLIDGSGAVEWVEERIGALTADALAALEQADVSADGYAALTDLARLATQRSA